MINPGQTVKKQLSYRSENWTKVYIQLRSGYIWKTTELRESAILAGGCSHTKAGQAVKNGSFIDRGSWLDLEWDIGNPPHPAALSVTTVISLANEVRRPVP